MDLAEMRGLVRRDLKDEDPANYRWVNDEIDRAIQRAVADLSRYVPKEEKATIATVDASYEIDISSLTDRVSVDKVEFPIDLHPREFQRFTVYQDILTLLGAYQGDGEDCYIYWSKVHTLDAASCTLPAYLEDLVALGASAYAALAQSQYHSDRANTGGDNVDRDYTYWGRDALSEFKRKLKAYGRNRKLKIGQFYSE